MWKVTRILNIIAKYTLKGKLKDVCWNERKDKFKQLGAQIRNKKHQVERYLANCSCNSNFQKLSALDPLGLYTLLLPIEFPFVVIPTSSLAEVHKKYLSLPWLNQSRKILKCLSSILALILPLLFCQRKLYHMQIIYGPSLGHSEGVMLWIHRFSVLCALICLFALFRKWGVP